MSNDKMGELRDRVQSLKDEIERLADLDEPAEADTVRLDEAVAEFTTARDELQVAEERAAKVAEIRQIAIEKPSHVADGTRTAKNDPVLGVRESNPFDLSELRFAQLDGEGMNAELMARARQAIEDAPAYVSDAAREAATRKVDQDAGKSYKRDGLDSNSMSEHVLKYGSPEYADNFMRYLRTGKMEERTALALAGSNGGYLLPTLLDPTVILTNGGTVNPFRKIATVESITQNVKNYVSSDGTTAGWIAEATEVTDGTPTFSNPSITCAKGFAHAFGSREIIEDADNLAGEITRIFADAKDRAESDAFVNGTGSGQPYGIVTALNLTTASRTAANTNGSFGAIDVFNLVNNLPARYQDSPNLAFVAHWFTYNLARQFGGPQQPNFWVELGPGIPAQMLGVSVYRSSQMLNAAGAVGLSAATASSDNLMILGDWSFYHIVDRVGMEIVYDPLVLGSNRRPTGQMSWTAFYRTGADSLNDGAFQMLRV